jgi:hypothetical protein
MRPQPFHRRRDLHHRRDGRVAELAVKGRPANSSRKHVS